MKGIDVAQAFALCEAIAHECTQATKAGEYADGYRCAGSDIARAISAKGEGRKPTPLERDLRDVEVEARTLARVVAVAAAVVADAGASTETADGIRKVLGAFFDPDDLPMVLRAREPDQSTTTLITRRLASG